MMAACYLLLRCDTSTCNVRAFAGESFTVRTTDYADADGKTVKADGLIDNDFWDPTGRLVDCPAQAAWESMFIRYLFRRRYCRFG